MPSNTVTPLIKPESALFASLKSEIAESLQIPLDKLPPKLTTDQTATVLDVKPNTLSVWRCTGRNNLPFLKTGKSPMYRVSDVVAFMARHYYEHADKVMMESAA